jgi:hypothetical protein
MKTRRTVLAIIILILALTTSGCYKVRVERDFSKAGQQTLDNWHMLPFAVVSAAKGGISIGQAFFSIPLTLGEEFEMRVELQASFANKDLDEFGICLSQGKIYFSPAGKNLIIRTESKGGASKHEVYSANFVIKDFTYASGSTLLPGFKLSGKNIITLWKKGTSFGWNVNGTKAGPFTLPAEFNSGVYVHFNISAADGGANALVINKIRVTGPKDSASLW